MYRYYIAYIEDGDLYCLMSHYFYYYREMKLLDEANDRLEHERSLAAGEYSEVNEDNNTSQSCCPLFNKFKRKGNNVVDSVRRKWFRIFYPKWVKEQELMYIQQLQEKNNKKKRRRENVPVSRNKTSAVQSPVEVSNSIHLLLIR
jgi:hypothetical protein